jgi:hypothetical protein
MNLIPAYGRDYRSKKAVQADLDADKDFLIADISSPYDGKPINAAQLRAEGVRRVQIRYDRQRKVAIFSVQGGAT